MKSLLFKFNLSLLLSIVASFSFAQTSVEFERKTISFKKVDEGKIIELIYNFKSFDKHQLTLTPPKVDCSCTEIIIPNKKISSGESYSITIKFDKKDKIGFQKKVII